MSNSNTSTDRARGILPVAAWLVQAASGEAAAADASAFSGEPDVVAQWARWAGIVALAAALVLVIASAVLGRRRITTTVRWMLLLGVVVLPAFGALDAWQVGLHQAKGVEACGSCHTMEPYVRDMRDPASKTLAAAHFQNRWIPDDQCYQCHTDYGLTGDLAAKRAGIGHILRYYSGYYETPIRASRQYGLEQCLKCHEGAKKFEALEEHRDPEVVEALRTGKTTCLECHAAPHPRPSTSGKEAPDVGTGPERR